MNPSMLVNSRIIGRNLSYLFWTVQSRIQLSARSVLLFILPESIKIAVKNWVRTNVYVYVYAGRAGCDLMYPYTFVRPRKFMNVVY